MEQYIVDRMETIDGKLDAILIQTTKTNGRVTSHDKDIWELKSDVKELLQSKHETSGRDKVIYILLGVVGTMVITVISLWFSKH